MKPKLILIQLLAVIALSLAPMSHGQIVYNNSALTSDLSVRFNPGTNEVGDEITLAAGGRVLTLFEFQYWGLSFSGDEQARLRLLSNDGAASPQGALMPGTVLFESVWFTIGATPRSTLIFSDFTSPSEATVPLTSLLPDDFTWSVQFRTLGVSASAGVDLYNPPITGSSFNDFWFNTGTTWELRTNSLTSDPMNFAARITTVPEPTTLWLAILGGVALLGVRLRYSRS